MYHVTRIDDARNELPTDYEARSKGFSRQLLVGASTGSPHMGLAACQLEVKGSIDSVVHSYENSLYVTAGELAIHVQGKTQLLGRDDCLNVPVGAPYSIRALDGPVSWLQMSAPAPFVDRRRQDTFFTGDEVDFGAAALPDLRDPRNLNAFHFDAESMDLSRLAVGSKVDAPTVSASMATALLAYSGIGVRMLVDQRLGAQLHTMFMVEYQPTAIAHPHDHPFEEAYIFVEGQVHALIEGDELVLGPGDVLWAGVGADHGFHNRSEGLVRWVETQAPQPPAQHSYRFSRDWEYLAAVLAEREASGTE
jgi:mannose-6-phosphate isomerase-like protein (cupin superfamily)